MHIESTMDGRIRGGWTTGLCCDAGIRIGLVAALVVGVMACSSSDHADLDKYVAEVKARKAGRITPLPEFKSYESYLYMPEQLRDPFVPGVEEAQISMAAGGPQPDLARSREPLESFPLDALKFVGHLEQQGEMWAIVTAPDGYVYRVQEGNYIGQNYGRIVRISESQISILEMVPNTLGGWFERDATLAVAE